MLKPKTCSSSSLCVLYASKTSPQTVKRKHNTALVPPDGRSCVWYAKNRSEEKGGAAPKTKRCRARPLVLRRCHLSSSSKLFLPGRLLYKKKQLLPHPPSPAAAAQALLSAQLCLSVSAALHFFTSSPGRAACWRRTSPPPQYPCRRPCRRQTSARPSRAA